MLKLAVSRYVDSIPVKGIGSSSRKKYAVLLQGKSCTPVNIRLLKQEQNINTESSKKSIHHTTPSLNSNNSVNNSVRQTVTIENETYVGDSWTNITPRITEKIGKNLHNKKYHPINLVRLRIQNYFYKNFTSHGNPIFAVFDNINPIVSPYQNFDSLLTPEDHPSRTKSDTYYINGGQLLRSHTSAHQEELVKMGFDAFLVVGDVYRRDEIDKSHYPVFHQMEGVRLFSEHEVFNKVKDPTNLFIFEDGRRTKDKQAAHTLEAVKLVEHDLKHSLLGVAKVLFGQNLEHRWVECYFPFTHPSWELEIMYEGNWMEVLGCGIMEQKLLTNAGASNKIGWAFGLGLDRLAMKLYSIPDIRLFWSEDPRFIQQFMVEDPETPITFKLFSQYPPCINDISFWIPENFSSNDFYDLVRNLGGETVESVELIDEFVHPKHHKKSHCYRITYRHMDRTYTQEEVNVIHAQIEQAASGNLGVELR